MFAFEVWFPGFVIYLIFAYSLEVPPLGMFDVGRFPGPRVVCLGIMSVGDALAMLLL